jgi:hypothetical protein
LAFAAAAKIGGVLPTAPMSIAPADAASRSGGPEVKVAHSILYGVSLSRFAAVSSDFAPPFWSPTFSVTFVRSSALTLVGMVVDVVAVPQAVSSTAASAPTSRVLRGFDIVYS